MISWAGTLARSSDKKQNNRLLAFLITSEIWQFHSKALAVATPNT